LGKGYSPEQIVRKLRQAEGKLAGGAKVPEVARELGISEATFHRWRKQYHGVSPQEDVWSYDFAMDSTEDGRRLKLMPVVDEYSRECLSLEVERSITAEEVVDTLRRLFIERGAPKYIRSDNGPEFIAEAVKRWLALCEVGTLYIEPGAPWENAYSETFVSRLRDELLNREVFANLKEAQVLSGDYRDHYNHYRPHGALGYLTPAEFATI
jgi:putative transposase